ncbi:MAG: PAS domain S-box protein [Spirochaetales bacterium]|nr:PAS domain S-box protein [Spirochaetales bacterium]
MKKIKVLIVEDESILSMDMTQSLETMGYEVIDAVPSGEEAIMLLKEEETDLILMDVQLAGVLDGIQAAELINKDHNIPIIYISGHTDELTLSRAKITGPYGYITKSFNYDELNTTMEMVVYKNELQRKVAENEYLLDATLDNIEDAVITVDTEGYIMYLNSSAARMMRINKADASNIKIDRIGIIWKNESGKEFVHPYKTQRKKRLKTTEYVMINKAAGTSLVVECTVNILYGDKNKIRGYVYLIKNIEERKKIAAIQSRLASIVESSQDAIVGIDTGGIINSWNSGAEKILGYNSTEVIGYNISMLTPSNYPNELPEKIDQLKKGLSASHYESIRQKKNGEMIEMSILTSPIIDRKGNMTGVSFIARDITEKKKLEKEIIEIGEKERERIGQDLHDSLGQQLTGVLLNVKSLENEVREQCPTLLVDMVIKTKDLIKDAIAQTRQLAKNLVPIMLQTEGLQHALIDLANYAETVYKKEVEMIIDHEITDINTITETQLYHIAQEAVNNAVKHADGSKIYISLKNVQSELVLSIKDNGKGISKNHVEGLGMRIMNYRANLINGSIYIHTEENEGTLVLCRVPMKTAEMDTL